MPSYHFPKKYIYRIPFFFKKQPLAHQNSIHSKYNFFVSGLVWLLLVCILNCEIQVAIIFKKAIFTKYVVVFLKSYIYSYYALLYNFRAIIKFIQDISSLFL